MAQTKSMTRKVIPYGDAAVDGLFMGAAAGLVMGAYLVLAGLLVGESPVALLGRFAPEDSNSLVAGAFLHVAVSSVYGTIFSMAYQIILRQAKSGLPIFIGGILGVIYAIVLWFFAQGIVIPSTGSSVGEILPGQFAVAHIIYGAILGFLTSKSQR